MTAAQRASLRRDRLRRPHPRPPSVGELVRIFAHGCLSGAVLGLILIARPSPASAPVRPVVVDVPYCMIPFDGRSIPCRDADAITGRSWDL